MAGVGGSSIGVRILLLLVFLPSIPILVVGGFYQPLRLDFLLMSALAAVYLLSIIKSLRISRYTLFFLLVGSFYIFNSSSRFVGLVQIFGYLSLFASFKIGSKAVRSEGNARILAKYLTVAVYAALTIHILGLLGISFDMYVGGAKYTVFGKYATFGMPFKFGLFLISVLFLIRAGIITSGKLMTLMLIISVLTCDSRISAVCVVLVVAFIFTNAASNIIFISTLLAVIASPKIVAMFSGLGEIQDDTSLAMRLVNLDNYVEWLDTYSLLLGHGALAFLEFGQAYGAPGPIDILSVRLFSEFGVPLSVIAFIVFACILRLVTETRVFLAFIICFVFYGFFNEGVVSLRSGNFYWFSFGTLYGQWKVRRFAQRKAGKIAFQPFSWVSVGGHQSFKQ